MMEAQAMTGMPPVSLLLISYSYPPVLGGSEMEAQRVCSALLRRGHRVTVVCAGGPPMPDVSDWVDPGGVPVRIFARRGTGRRKDYTFALAVAWTLFRERRNYQVVYFLMQGLHLATGLPVARWLGKPIMMKVSGSSIITVMRSSWLGRVELRWLQKWARRVMILNPGMAEEAVAAGFEPQHLLWMPNPVDTDEFAPCSPERRRKLRAELGMPPQAASVVFVGRLAPEKELSSLIGAFAAVVQRMPQAILVLVGDGPGRKELEGQVSRLSLSRNVRFTGRCAAAEVRQWLQASDVFALVSSNEGFSCSLSEAMSAGLASVVSDIPANAQLIDPDVHGLRAKLRDEASIAEALTRLLGDEALRARMGRAARQRVLDNYSVDRVVARYEALFREALGGPTGAPHIANLA
jgi:glycosyltransferase involved in cell wall biosynthesis